MNTDLSFPVTAKKIGPAAVVRTRPKVFYLKSSDLIKMEPDTVRNATVLKVQDLKKKVEIYESPSEFLAVQAQAQGATASIYAASFFSTTAATGATPALATDIRTYFTEINAGGGLSVELPDPFVKRLCVIQNNAASAITVFGRGTTTPINGSTAGYSLGVGKRAHFLAPTAATAGTTAPWQTAVDA